MTRINVVVKQADMMYHWNYLIVFLSGILLSTLMIEGNARAEAASDMESTRAGYHKLFHKLTDLTLLAVPPVEGECSGSKTSADPVAQYDEATDAYIHWDSNGDSAGRLYDEGDDWVVFDQDGPGVIWRIWAGSCKAGHIKIYIDNASEPTVDEPFAEFMGRFASFMPNCPNLGPVLSRGSVRLAPIPYNKHCKIVFCKDWGSYHQITYTTYPEGTELPTYTGPIEKAMYFGLMATDRAFQLRGEYPYPDEDLKQRHEWVSPIEPGETKEVFLDPRSGAITMLRWNLSNVPRAKRSAIMRGLKLNIYWDGHETASVSAPFGDFFGSAPGYNPYRAYPMGMALDTCYSYFYMPYKTARITLTNEGNETVIPQIALLSEPVSEKIADETMRFCAQWQDTGDWGDLARERFAEGGDRYPDWPVIRLSGVGRFCGFALHVDNQWQPSDFPKVKWWEGQQTLDYPIIDNFHWWGEGDEKFFVDGEKFPSTFGTGTEDYIGYSLAAIPPFILFDSAYACQSLVPIENNNGLTSLVRFQVTDNIPYQKSFDGFLEKYRAEHWKQDDIIGQCYFTCTAYWYEKF